MSMHAHHQYDKAISCHVPSASAIDENHCSNEHAEDNSTMHGLMNIQLHHTSTCNIWCWHLQGSTGCIATRNFMSSHTQLSFVALPMILTCTILLLLMNAA